MFNKIFKIGCDILKDKNIRYNEEEFYDGFTTQPFYNFLCGFINFKNIKNCIEIGTHKGGSSIAMSNGFKYNNFKIITVDIKKYNYSLKNIDMLYGSGDSEIIKNKIKNLYDNNDGPYILFIDGLKSGEFIETVINNLSFDNVKYIFIDDITINIKMRHWWYKFSKDKKNYYNIVDYIGGKCSKNGLGFIDINNNLFNEL